VAATPRRSMASQQNSSPGLRDDLRLPPEVRLLRRREREIAIIIYQSRAATADQVVKALSSRLDNASVRSMLNRLVAKGILKRTMSGTAFVYLPALTPADSRLKALRQFADDFFDGSLARAAQTIKAFNSRR